MGETDPKTYREKLASIGFLKGGRTRPRVRETREHPETGKRAKAVTDELGNTQTYHSTGDTERVDAHLRPDVVKGFGKGQ